MSADSKQCWAKHKEEVLKAIEEKDFKKLHEMGLRVVATRQAAHRRYLCRNAHSRKIQGSESAISRGDKYWIGFVPGP